MTVLSQLLPLLPPDAPTGAGVVVLVAAPAVRQMLKSAARGARWVLDSDERTARLVQLLEAARRGPR
ncbi:hypothetical protein AB6N24_17885 [Cellulomonas sp. 179-A 4D5 NHS]|uniref:hypothetical protein n=1 Tax=Cellulomonas sp. 179-A 4D5 NHS TaxID=3142378 RepID=UPI0039A1C00F